MGQQMVNGVLTWVPDTDGGLAAFSRNRYNMTGLNGYGGMDQPVSNVITSNTPSPVANVNAQNALNGYNFSGIPKVVSPVAGGLGDYGTYTENGVSTGVDQSAFDAMKSVGTTGLEKNSTGWWDSLKNSFNPEGTSGRSYAGNVMDFAGTAAGIGTGLAGAYYAKKNFDLQKDQQDYLRGREAKSDARIAQFAANAGNGASYKY